EPGFLSRLPLHDRGCCPGRRCSPGILDCIFRDRAANLQAHPDVRSRTFARVPKSAMLPHANATLAVATHRYSCLQASVQSTQVLSVMMLSVEILFPSNCDSSSG